MIAGGSASSSPGVAAHGVALTIARHKISNSRGSDGQQMALLFPRANLNGDRGALWGFVLAAIFLAMMLTPPIEPAPRLYRSDITHIRVGNKTRNVRISVEIVANAGLANRSMSQTCTSPKDRS